MTGKAVFDKVMLRHHLRSKEEHESAGLVCLIIEKIGSRLVHHPARTTRRKRYYRGRCKWATSKPKPSVPPTSPPSHSLGGYCRNIDPVVLVLVPVPDQPDSGAPLLPAYGGGVASDQRAGIVTCPALYQKQPLVSGVPKLFAGLDLNQLPQPVHCGGKGFFGLQFAFLISFQVFVRFRELAPNDHR